MQLHTNRIRGKNRLLIIIVSIVVLLAALSVYVFAFNGSLFGWPHRNSPTATKIDLNPPTKEQLKDSQNIKQQTVDKDQAAKQVSPTAPTPIPVSISASNKTSSLFQVRALIDSLVSDGSCTIVLTKDSSIVTKTAKTVLLASTSTCDGFDIPLSELTSGTWTYTITVVNNTDNNSGKTTGTVAV